MAEGVYAEALQRGVARNLRFLNSLLRVHCSGPDLESGERVCCCSEAAKPGPDLSSVLAAAEFFRERIPEEGFEPDEHSYALMIGYRSLLAHGCLGVFSHFLVLLSQHVLQEQRPGNRNPLLERGPSEELEEDRKSVV